MVRAGRRAAILVACGLAALLALAGPAGAAPTAGATRNTGPTVADPMAIRAPAAADTYGLTEVSSKMTGRSVSLEFNTAALTNTTPVTVLLPSNYAASPHKRYPVLYLLDGCCNSANSWIDKEDVDALTAKLGLIVVMAEGGESGFYVNWYNEGKFGPPEYETYYIDQLLPWIDAHFRTTGAKRGRALAGMSMGGFGAMSLAAKYPNLFTAAASFSGLVDIDEPVGWLFTDTLTDLQGNTIDSNAIFGNHATESIREAGSNPWDLAENLRGLTLVIRTGNGLPGGPLGYGSGVPGFDPIEANVGMESQAFHTQLDSLGIPNVYDNYGPGNHSAPYWQRDLQETLPEFMAAFAHPAPLPAQVTYTSIQPQYSAYGWSVSVTRPALEFSTLTDASASGFSFSGSGTATVTTPADYKPGSTHTITVSNGASTSTASLVANARGQLIIWIDLGPGNPFQEQTPQADAAGTKVFTAGVTISPS